MACYKYINTTLKKSKFPKYLRRAARVLAVVILLFIILVLFIRSSWGQNLIVSKATVFVSEKTGTKVDIERLFLTFSGNLSLEGLYLEDTKGDTLVYSKSLEADIGLSKLLFDNAFDLEYLKWEGLKAKVTRPENSEDFNFTFLLDAFAAQDSTPAPVEQDAEPLEISVGTVDLNDFDIVYDDGFLGIDSKFNLGRLLLKADKLDLETMRFELDQVDLRNTTASYKQTKPFVETIDTTESVLPYLVINSFTLNTVKANYNSLPDSLQANLLIGNFLLEMPKADLANNDIEVEQLLLKNSDLALRMKSASEQPADSLAAPAPNFEWPEFLVQVDDIDIENNTIALSTGTSKATPGVFNANAIALSDFTLRAQNILYRPELVNLNLEQLAFREGSGFELKNFGFKASLNNTATKVTGLNLAVNNSALLRRAFAAIRFS